MPYCLAIQLGAHKNLSIKMTFRLHLSTPVRTALTERQPIVALESTLITHGLPRPLNLEVAQRLEAVVRDNGATPATIALLDGELYAGLEPDQLERLANAEDVRKVSRRDLPIVTARKGHGATTVAATMWVAAQAGIKVFATGGIGGVHDESGFDISADLQALATIPMIVVCAGTKSILDVPATLEYLETMSVPVIGFGTDDFPAFYSRESGLEVTEKLDNPQAVIDFAKAHWGAGLQSAVLVANPVPEREAIPKSEMDPFIDKAKQEAGDRNVYGKELTPFLLERINVLTEGKSMKANLALLLNNARLAARIAKSLRASERRKIS